MKRLLLLLSLIFACGALYAAPPVAIAPINDVGTPVTISISSTTLTKVPSSQETGRMGIYVSNASTRPVSGFFGDCSSTALASTIRPIRIVTNDGEDGSEFFDIRDDVCLWLISTETTTSSQDIHYQEIKR